MSAELYLISCVKAKLPVFEPVRARDLYISPWFKRARSYVESTKQPWFILSAEYGLVCPNAEILPYAKTLNSMPKDSEFSTHLTAFTIVLYPTLSRRAIVEAFKPSSFRCSAVVAIS